MAKYNLRRIDLHVPQYDTEATITVDQDPGSGEWLLAAKYKKGGSQPDDEMAAEIPGDWSDQDLAELVFLPIKARTTRNWPAWEIPARDHGSPSLYRFWKGEKAPES